MLPSVITDASRVIMATRLLVGELQIVGHFKTSIYAIRTNDFIHTRTVLYLYELLKGMAYIIGIRHLTISNCGIHHSSTFAPRILAACPSSPALSFRGESLHQLTKPIIVIS